MKITEEALQGLRNIEKQTAALEQGNRKSLKFVAVSHSTLLLAKW